MFGIWCLNILVLLIAIGAVNGYRINKRSLSSPALTDRKKRLYEETIKQKDQAVLEAKVSLKEHLSGKPFQQVWEQLDDVLWRLESCYGTEDQALNENLDKAVAEVKELQNKLENAEPSAQELMLEAQLELDIGNFHDAKSAVESAINVLEKAVKNDPGLKEELLKAYSLSKKIPDSNDEQSLLLFARQQYEKHKHLLVDARKLLEKRDRTWENLTEAYNNSVEAVESLEKYAARLKASEVENDEIMEELRRANELRIKIKAEMWKEHKASKQY